MGGVVKIFPNRIVILFAIVLFTSFVFISPLKSFAWSCGNSLEPKDLFKRHDSVFIGKVVGSSYEHVGSLNPKSRVTLEVKSLLKGNRKETATVVTTAGSVFLEGKEYLVYAYKTTKENYLYQYEEGEFATDTMCGGTKELSIADYDLEQIADMKSFSAVLKVIITISSVGLVIIMLFMILMKRKNN